jgi:hypothetical protein
MSFDDYSARELQIQNEIVLPILLGCAPFVASQSRRLHVGFEQYAVFSSVLATLRPKVALEIGTFEGQTLGLISRHSERAISIDPDPSVERKLSPQMPNCRFITATSDAALPTLISEFNEQKTPLEFVFVDGNHARDFVYRDLKNLLTYRPVTKTVILMHDSFNPGCRAGILDVDWSGCPHCHYVEVDFCPGLLHPNQDCRGEMWGGLGLALLLPEERTSKLVVRQTHRLTFEAALEKQQAPKKSWFRRLLEKL